LEFLDKFFIEVPNIKFDGNSISGSRADACRQTDGWTGGHDERNKRLSMRTCI